MIKRNPSSVWAGAVAGALMLTGCSAGALGTSSGVATGDGSAVTITFEIDNADSTVKMANALADGFMKANPDIIVKVEQRPGGTDGDNLVKTKLSTGDMADVFEYNSGSLMQALDPGKNLVSLTGEALMADLDESFKTAVTSEAEVYGVPFGQATGGGILYNKEVFAKLGLSVPTTWDEFMANNAKIKAAGIDPVIQTYGDTWTSQLFVLSDFHNVLAADPDWATKYTANDPSAKYAVDPALKGFQRLASVSAAGYLNKDFASIKSTKGLQNLVSGRGAQYPMLTSMVTTYSEMSDDAASTIGFFAQPGDDGSKVGATVWTPPAVYIPTTTTGANLDAAKKFVSWIATPAACDAQSSAVEPTGPYMVKGCSLPDGLATAVTDLNRYVEDGATSPALEFLSPVKGPNLEKITVEVGSGMTSAEDGARRYDEDVKKQAQQLGLEGW